MIVIFKIFYGLILIGCGYGILRYRREVKSWTGSFYWAEHYLGNGSTYLVINLFGMGLIFAGVMYPFGGLDSLFNK